MLQRGINEETVRYVLEAPDFVRRSFDGRKIAVKRVGEKRLDVVFVERETIKIVVTTYYE